ncbi:MAG: hypothetical protein ACYTXY_40520, partial [Nostoc sp.]
MRYSRRCHGTLLYVLYEVLSGTAISAIQLPQAQEEQLIEWLQPYQELLYKVLATLSDGEKSSFMEPSNSSNSTLTNNDQTQNKIATQSPS